MIVLLSGHRISVNWKIYLETVFLDVCFFFFSFLIGKHGFQCSEINNECTNILPVSPHRHAHYISSWASWTTACRIKSRRLACFRNNIHEMSKPNPPLHEAPAGNRCLCNSEGWGPTLLFILLFFLFFFFLQTHSLCSHYYLGDLALNQGQRCSTFWLLITTVRLTYFKRSKREMARDDGAAAAAAAADAAAC